jgi:hypothetical protein
MLEFFLVMIAGVANAFMDTSAIGNFKNKWLNKGQTAKSKWLTVGTNNNKVPNKTRPWYYLWLYKPEFKEIFPYSSTILVWMTDPWHVFQLVMLTAFELAITLNIDFLPNSFFDFLPYTSISVEVLEFLAIKALFSAFFTLFYKLIIPKKLKL